MKTYDQHIEEAENLLGRVKSMASSGRYYKPEELEVFAKAARVHLEIAEFLVK